MKNGSPAGNLDLQTDWTKTELPALCLEACVYRTVVNRGSSLDSCDFPLVYLAEVATTSHLVVTVNKTNL